MLTTGTFIRLGCSYGNPRIYMQPKNSKLLDRARRIVATARGLSYEDMATLEAAGNNVKAAIHAQSGRDK